MRAAQLISEAHGEFIQDSSVTGDGNQLGANLTRRVAPGRVSEVLDALRELGEVRSENAGGEDVTTQLVDLDARVRSERRVEAEPLELLETRANAPLKEVLELRRSLSEVRGSSEQLTGQRERLGRLVSLASVVVIIRPADAPTASQPGLGSSLHVVLSDALRNSGRFLADSLALLASIVVGGSIWWVLLAAAALAIRAGVRASRDTQRVAAQQVA